MDKRLDTSCKTTFEEHLRKVSEMVSMWPDWKKDIIRGSISLKWPYKESPFGYNT